MILSKLPRPGHIPVEVKPLIFIVSAAVTGALFASARKLGTDDSLRKRNA
ncbi:hypothetical protein K450DRAFT_224235 [Umbelopsis ramanniana AG]|uniref:Uncharacterized protein n=1 Tax=Umbelopsis ramanniana AG TaxID=1314678 RepID=A0AAD5EIV4_UMBRA|nr:uncharacterized protein K450DRAFT_224235 [Umbelopsis ramanniana AG]KAI8583105.1 hypothetical protein K450DRAFT_224235 [Umbelopsis ramanniana AG]